MSANSVNDYQINGKSCNFKKHKTQMKLDQIDDTDMIKRRTKKIPKTEIESTDQLLTPTSSSIENVIQSADCQIDSQNQCVVGLNLYDQVGTKYFT